MDKSVLKTMEERLDEGRLACNQAFAIAEIRGVEPVEVGMAANEADIRISRCQLGLFGYGPKAMGEHKIVGPMEEVPEELAARLRAEAAGEDITCAAVWRAADGLGLRRIEASSAVETLGLKVSRCQLACFPRPWVG